MMRACHLNTCPVGIATQDPVLRKNFKGTPEHVVNYMYFVAEELRSIMAELGFRTVKEMVGQVQKIDASKATDSYKTRGIDLSAILHRPEGEGSHILSNTEKQDHGLENVLDMTINRDAKAAIEHKVATELNYKIQNTDRTVGAIISNEISKIHGKEGLPEDTLKLNFSGSAGQSFGGFATKGVTMTVEGETNDYLGKGLSGAKIIVKKPAVADFIAEENIITGNVSFYGAVSGEAYINGIAGERFAVRNSGVTTVVEGVGDHGCEYMTGGKVVVLGKTGRNFAAGMSGGIAFIYDKDKTFEEISCNPEMVDLVDLTKEDRAELKALVEKHQEYTDSALATRLLGNWENEIKNFVKVFPTDYKIALERIEREKEQAPKTA
jgi:glutamate synthase (ferredoxin)